MKHLSLHHTTFDARSASLQIQQNASFTYILRGLKKIIIIMYRVRNRHRTRPGNLHGVQALCLTCLGIEKLPGIQQWKASDIQPRMSPAMSPTYVRLWCQPHKCQHHDMVGMTVGQHRQDICESSWQVRIATAQQALPSTAPVTASPYQQLPHSTDGCLRKQDKVPKPSDQLRKKLEAEKDEMRRKTQCPARKQTLTPYLAAAKIKVFLVPYNTT